jgi:hypothetical protein
MVAWRYVSKDNGYVCQRRTPRSTQKKNHRDGPKVGKIGAS